MGGRERERKGERALEKKEERGKREREKGREKTDMVMGDQL